MCQMRELLQWPAWTQTHLLTNSWWGFICGGLYWSWRRSWGAGACHKTFEKVENILREVLRHCQKLQARDINMTVPEHQRLGRYLSKQILEASMATWSLWQRLVREVCAEIELECSTWLMMPWDLVLKGNKAPSLVLAPKCLAKMH